MIEALPLFLTARNAGRLAWTCFAVNVILERRLLLCTLGVVEYLSCCCFPPCFLLFCLSIF